MGAGAAAAKSWPNGGSCAPGPQRLVWSQLVTSPAQSRRQLVILADPASRASGLLSTYVGGDGHALRLAPPGSPTRHAAQQGTTLTDGYLKVDSSQPTADRRRDRAGTVRQHRHNYPAANDSFGIDLLPAAPVRAPGQQGKPRSARHACHGYDHFPAAKAMGADRRRAAAHIADSVAWG